ncbi:hypothetical protein [Segatella copri]|jgi:hypothetical protein|uniref:DUF4906 domain-containing protein n=1 Tax=Segatella copri TaxID=165179 RepID=A0AAW5I3Y2_9BACT|nr:hypothetical protein [Segatella copri]MCF0067359.1 hypothetical protein [Segatella copri]MCP9459157.1 hypothetical protein [Segatella copri]MCP9501521.1 hypothetical protein [Segatella copri]MCP9504300.1 hypothetical protein [Segatella copri]MCP9507559.1 hypothetical protein [Segatella copri]
MKQIRLHIGMIAVLLTFMLAACTDCIVDNETSSNEAEDGYYTAHFNVSIPSFEQQVTRSTLFTNEGIGKNCVKLFCFDEEGQFVGFGKVGEFGEIKGFRRDVNGNIIQNGDKDIDNNGQTTPRNFSAQIPNKTARIHLVANTESQYKTIDWENQSKWVGMHENILMTTFETEYGEDQAALTRYWGYIKEDSPEKLKEYLRQDNTKQDYIIHLIRDRAKISAEWSKQAKEAPNSNLKDEDLTMTVVNGMAYGTLAPFNRDSLLFNPTTGDNKWEWKVDYVTPAISNKKMKGDKRQMYNPTAAFEDRNLPTDPAKVLLKYNNKCYLIYLQDQNNVPYAIKRNYEYKIIIDKLDENNGKNSLEEALKSAPINNPWIRVEQYIPGVNDGNYELAINEGTYQTTNAASGSEQFIEFTYKGDNKEPTDFVALWTENLSFGTTAAPEVTSYKYNEASKTGTGTIKYKLGTVDKTWREGIIYLTDKKHGLNRNIHLYSINEVQYQVNAPANIGTNANAEAEFKFTVPANYPKELLPVTVKFASGDVVPEGCDIEYSSTRELNKTWDCWYVFKAGEAGKTYSLNLKNVHQNATGNATYYVKMDNANQGQAKEYEITYK